MDVNTLMKIVSSPASTTALSLLTGGTSNQIIKVLNFVMPILLKGANAQATGKKTAESFAKAIEDHSGADTSDLGAFLSGVDTADGAKIIQHLLGTKTASVTEDAAKESGMDAAAVMKILIAVAPLLLSILGQQKKKHGDTGSELLSMILQSASTQAKESGSLLGMLGKFLK